MELLRRAILERGSALNEHVLLVDSFLNHQVDPELIYSVGRELARRCERYAPTRVATIESSGIAPAFAAAREMGLPLVIMKKSASRILTGEVLQTEVRSFTKNATYQLTLKPRFMPSGERVLLIDDFLAMGEAASGAAALIERAGASVAAIGIVIEKSFQPGRAMLERKGYRVESLARVKRMEENIIEFEED